MVQYFFFHSYFSFLSRSLYIFHLSAHVSASSLSRERGGKRSRLIEEEEKEGKGKKLCLGEYDEYVVCERMGKGKSTIKEGEACCSIIVNKN